MDELKKRGAFNYSGFKKMMYIPCHAAHPDV